jgi:hypothetical protein
VCTYVTPFALAYQANSLSIGNKTLGVKVFTFVAEHRQSQFFPQPVVVLPRRCAVYRYAVQVAEPPWGLLI